MSGTDVPPIQFTPSGLIVPTESAVLEGVQNDLNSAFGGNLNPALNTPQGQLATAEAAAIAQNNALFAYFVSQINPDIASGFMQDAIGRIYFLNRLPALPTVVTCTVTGAVGTPIPVGAQAQDTSGNLYVCTSAVTIPSGGSATATFANIVNGPVACPDNTLTKIYVQIPGWNTINNPGPGSAVLGQNVESQAAFEFRRKQSVALNAHGSPDAIYANVFQVPGVLDVFVIDNVTGSPVLYGATNYSLAAHSVYVGVTGGNAQAIANAIWQAKDLGCNMNGTTTETVVDNINYQPPYPTYSITFNIPTNTPVFFAVDIAPNPLLPSNIATLVQNAIIAQFIGTNGALRARMGSTIFASSYYAPILALAAPGVIDIKSLFVGLAASPTTTSVTMGIDQEPTIIAGDISVTVA